MGILANSRFNPKAGILDFWHEVRKPNPYRWPILVISTIPFATIMWWLIGETVYADPEKPQITYITTFAPDRSDEEIMASNIANQEVRELRAQYEEELAQRKRDLYKALGAATGIDVEEAERRGEEARAANAAAEQARLDELMGRTPGSSDAEIAEAAGGDGSNSDESSAP